MSSKDKGNGMDSRQALHSSNTNEWYTPSRYIEAARAVMGGIDLDPASCLKAQETVKATEWHGEPYDGLLMPWWGRVWMNPPYGRRNGKSNQAVWTERAVAAANDGEVDQAILLVNSETSCAWFQSLWGYPICFTDHRIRFIDANGVEQRSPTQGNAFIYIPDYLTPGYEDSVSRFVDAFTEFGHVVRP